MANLVEKITLGIDVAKDHHVIYNWQTKQTTKLSNERSDIKAWLKSFHGAVRIAIEPTSHYHMIMVNEALELGYEVYLINPRQLLHYREAVNERNKTDPLDAWLLVVPGTGPLLCLNVRDDNSSTIRQPSWVLIRTSAEHQYDLLRNRFGQSKSFNR
ncbi:transposase [Pseudomonadota bacterium]